MAGPLAGIRIIEIESIGPGPFAAMMLADHGAEVTRIARPGTAFSPRDILARSRQVVTLDLKTPEGVNTTKALIQDADGLIEGFRPGTMERLGLGPEHLEGNSKLVYGRMTGWGQTGPYARWAGHDINYIALSGALHAIGNAGEKPVPPLNLIGDYGGGGMLLAFGMVAALFHAQRTGQGQVVDCAMTEGSALLMSQIYSMLAAGTWRDQRGVNILDGGAHFYQTYETSDKHFIAVAPIEPQFYREFLKRVGIAEDLNFNEQMNEKSWPTLRQKLTKLFRTRTRDEWCRLLEYSDACFAPVLSMSEAPLHPHNRARKVFVDVGGVTQPAPAPRYSISRLDTPRPPEVLESTELDAMIAAARIVR
jgi:alpha-methylacyl-CoA racemase